MERRQVLKTSGIVLTAGVAGLAGCSGGSDGDSEPQEPASNGGSGDLSTVQMFTKGGDYYFDPIGLFVEVGDTVTFENTEGNHSTVAYKDGIGQAATTRIPEDAEGWESSILTASGATFEHTFDTAGTYDYFCGPHKSVEMVGRIVVGESGGVAEGSMPPDGSVPDSQTIVDSESVSYEEFSG